MSEMEILARLGFHDEEKGQREALTDLFIAYERTEGTSKTVVINASVDGEDVIFNIGVGFDYLAISKKDLKELLK